MLYMLSVPLWNSNSIFVRTFKYLILRNTNSCTKVLGKTAYSGSTEMLKILLKIFCWKKTPSMFVQELLLRKIKYLNIQACTVCLKSTQMFNILFGIFCWRWRWEILNGLLWLKRQLCSKRNTNRDVWRKCIIFWENFRLQLIGSG